MADKPEIVHVQGNANEVVAPSSWMYEAGAERRERELKEAGGGR